MEIQIPTLLRMKPNCLQKLGKYLRKAGFHKVALFFGEGMKELVGPTVAISFDACEIVVSIERTIGDIQIDQVFQSTFSLPHGTQALVAIGGGMVIDYCKYIAFLSHLPLMSVPTSISNDGFASPTASLYVDGRRRSLKARIAYGVVMDTEIIRKSPKKLTISGIGDLVSKFTAVWDWKAAYRETGESVNDFAVMVALTGAESVAGAPKKDLDDLNFLRTVCSALVMSGVSMEVSGSSRPASGSEHLISHAYDRLAKKPTLHGLQVGVATLAVSWLQNNPNRPVIQSLLADCGFDALLLENPLEKSAFVEAVRESYKVKEGYYTVLSPAENRENLIRELQSNSFWNQYLK